jgi:hypothetical protein
MLVSMSTLSVYLNDHIAGATAALDLLNYLECEYKGTELGSFARKLKTRLVADKLVVERILASTNGSTSSIKRMSGWLGSRLSRLKFGRRKALGSFEALEMLRIGVLGKIGLWEVLQISLDASRLPFTCDFNLLISDAKDQLKSIEVQRFKLINQIFGSIRSN